MVTEFNVSIIVDDENTCVDMIVKKTENVDISKLQGLCKIVNPVPAMIKNRIDKYLDRLVKSEASNADAALTSSAEEENIVTPQNIEGSDIPIEE